MIVLVTLRARLLSGLGLLVLTAVASSGWLALQVARRQLVQAQEADARASGERFLRVLAASAAESGGTLDDPSTRERLRALVGDWRARGMVRDAAIVKDGVVLVGRADADDALGAVASGVVVRRDGAGLRVFGSIAGPSGDRAAARIELPGEDLIARALASATWLVMLSALFCAAVVLLFGAVFIERIASSIGALAGAARRVASGDLDAPPLGASSARGDELSRLAADFDEMTAALRRERATVAAQRDTMVAQEKLATVGRLAAGVAHEIGNPLAAILGFSDMLRQDQDEVRAERKLDAADRRDALVRIGGEAARIQSIIRELLDYSRPAKEELLSVELGEIIDRALSLLRPQPRFRDVEVERAWPEGLRVRTVASRVEQIVVNLLLNAADAMGGRGRVVITAMAVGARVELAIEDSGPGVPEADRGKIFDPFFSTKDPGTGLGLSVSLALAQAVGASLTLRTPQPERGASFVLSLPVNDAR